ncbi:MAG: hypothetical protein JRG70_07810 [Deltaproteobacteria bacterium]|nr:hypothetical protein [Deltaproteobacteria bacterium]
MYRTFATNAVTEFLLNEVAHSSVSLDPVLFFYTAVFATVAVLWTIGVLAFGKSRVSPVAP